MTSLPFVWSRQIVQPAVASIPEVKPDLQITRLLLVSFFPFAAGYFLSYLFRTVNALVAPDLIGDLGFTPPDLGLLTSAYFFAFALAQVPLGILLDRFGPRRVQSALLLVAGAGSLVFAMGQSLTALTLGRILIGLGVSGALMAGLKSIVQCFPKERLGLVNGCFIMFGGLGAYAAAGPSEMLLQLADWRLLFFVLTGLTVLVSSLIFFVAPECSTGGTQSTMREVASGLSRVYRNPFFWRIAPASGCAIGAAWAVQGLWASRWLAEVERLSRADIVTHLSMMAGALCLGSLILGAALDRLKKMGVATKTIMGAAFAAFIAVEVLVVCRIPVPSSLVWPAFGAFASATVLGYTLLGEHFPKEFAGRANTALNLVHMLMAFALQWAMGWIVGLWANNNGYPPTEAYQAAFALPLVLQSLSLCWMFAFMPEARSTTAPAAG